MIKEFDVVKTRLALPAGGIAAGAQGVVLHVFHNPSTAYLVEFLDQDGEPKHEQTLTADEVEP